MFEVISCIKGDGWGFFCYHVESLLSFLASNPDAQAHLSLGWLLMG